MRILKRIAVFTLLLISLGVAFLYGLSRFIAQETSPRIYSDIDSLPAASTAIVLGASVHADGQLSPILQDRMDSALNLYRKGKVKNFLLSGDHRTDDYDEVNAMRNYLLDRSVPSYHITTDPSGIDTYDSMFRSSRVYNITDAIVVTQKFHLPRALFIAKNMGLNHVGYPANAREYETEGSLIRREKLANVKAVFELLTK
ncbi:YdcF family protein [Gillisia sp. M10.2A]|uniref:YdcF family protein n=1 Tax=Gillisia lutea TaxID=2909668 RepID=A0ABS9EEJ2_9FLAO|nr:ElyC/SanA/YdcF family protein [Gillisia lutea]MCF4101292.1 YdcF family protein [Gillisia lutea]